MCLAIVAVASIEGETHFMPKRPPLPQELDHEVRQFRRYLRTITRSLGALTRMLQESLGIPTTELHLLMHLLERVPGDGSGPSAADLCEELRLDKGAMSRALGGLERRGLIRRETAPEDHRRQTVDLTRKGREFARHIDREAQHWDSEFLAQMSDADRKELLAGLGHLNQMFLDKGDDVFTAGETLAARIRDRMKDEAEVE